MNTHPSARRRSTLAAGAVLVASTLAACSPAAQPTTPAPAPVVAPSTTSTAPVVPSRAPAVPAAPSATGTKATTASKSTTPSKSTTSSKTATSTTKAASGVITDAEITRLAVPSVGFDEAVSPVPTTEMGGAIDPDIPKDGSPNLPVRVSDKGVKVGTSTDDTTYLGCHTSDHIGDAAFPCNKLIRSAQQGDKIVVTTDQGQLTYKITETRSIPKEDFATDDETWRVQPNRLVFVICDVVGGSGNHHNWVIYADTVK